MNPAWIVGCACAVFFCCTVLQASAAEHEAARAFSKQQRDRKLPPALEGVPLERLSSGALRLLDQNGDLIQWPGATRTSANALATDPSIVAGLDPRVGAN